MTAGLLLPDHSWSQARDNESRIISSETSRESVSFQAPLKSLASLRSRRSTVVEQPDTAANASSARPARTDNP